MKIHQSRNLYLKIRSRDGVESLTTLEEGEFKVSIDGFMNVTCNSSTTEELWGDLCMLFAASPLTFVVVVVVAIVPRTSPSDFHIKNIWNDNFTIELWLIVHWITVRDSATSVLRWPIYTRTISGKTLLRN